MEGYSGKHDDPSSSSSNSSESIQPPKGNNRKGGDPSDSSSNSSQSSDGNIFRQEPESDHSSDSDGTKRRKHEKHCRHRAKMNTLKYHQSFLKNDSPFKYNGEIQASTYKKWCQEVHDWIKDGHLGHKRGIHQPGKYLTGKAYKFFKQNVLQNRIKYTPTDYFAALFDYIFPADFHMQQQDKFDVYYQGNLSVIDFLRRLQDLADTVGDLDDSNVVLAFWHCCKPYVRAELTRAGHEPLELTSSELEVLATRIERADEVAHEMQKGTSSKPVQSCGGPKRYNRDTNPPQSTQSTPSNGGNMNNSLHSTKLSSHPIIKLNSSKRPCRDHPDQDKECQ